MTTTTTTIGIEARPVDLIVATNTAVKPSLEIVGLPELAARETSVRVRSALRTAGFDLTAGDQQAVIVSLTPADLHKDGTHYDLPTALAILEAAGKIEAAASDGWIAVGELSLTGKIRPVRGVLAVAELARGLGMSGVICAPENAKEARVAGVGVRVAATLADTVACLWSGYWPTVLPASAAPHRDLLCWSDVRGQDSAKRALEVAAAGGHGALLVGPPGSGKTMLARRLSTILPPLAGQEAITATKIYSVAGLLPPGAGLLTERSFRAPHHTVSVAAMVGGGATPRPGEVSLAHGGVLFLDELLEFSRSVLETLQRPMEDGHVTIARTRQVVRFPARFELVAATNPCPCGWRGSARECSCTDASIDRYIARADVLAGHLPIRVEVPALHASATTSATSAGETSETVRARVVAARDRQAYRWGAGARLNSSTPIAAVRALLPDHPLALALSDAGARVALTVCDMRGGGMVSGADLDEAAALTAAD